MKNLDHDNDAKNSRPSKQSYNLQYGICKFDEDRYGVVVEHTLFRGETLFSAYSSCIRIPNGLGFVVLYVNLYLNETHPAIHLEYVLHRMTDLLYDVQR